MEKLVKLKVLIKKHNEVDDNVANKGDSKTVKLAFYFKNCVTGSTTFKAFPVDA